MRRSLALALWVPVVALVSHAQTPGPSSSTESVSVHVDKNGAPFLGHVGIDGDRILEQLGFAPKYAPAAPLVLRESAGQEGHFRHSWRGEYFRVDRQEWPAKHAATDGGPSHRIMDSSETTLSVLGVEISARWTRLSEPASFRVEDSLDGWVEFGRGARGVRWARDSHGELLGVVYDKLNRIKAIYIGLDYILETDYPESDDPIEAWEWTERRLKNRDGELLARWRWNEETPPIRPGAQLWTTGIPAVGMAATVAEWDAELYPEGAAVLTTFGEVSLFGPASPGTNPWRSIRLPSENVGGKRPLRIGRLDFTETEYRLWIHLGYPTEPDGETLGASDVVHLPRLPMTPERANAFQTAGPF